MFPVISYIILDNPEMKLVYGVKDSQDTKLPCHVCKVPREDSDNPSAKYEFRLAGESHAALKQYVDAVYGDKGNKLVVVEAMSLNGSIIAFYDANMGVPEGIH